MEANIETLRDEISNHVLFVNRGAAARLYQDVNRGHSNCLYVMKTGRKENGCPENPIRDEWYRCCGNMRSFEATCRSRRKVEETKDNEAV